MGHLSLELGEVTRDRRHVEASEDRFLRLTVEQEPEGCFEAALRRVFACRQPLAHLSRHRDVVPSLAISLADDHIENEGLALAGEPDLDHVAFLSDRGRVANSTHLIYEDRHDSIYCNNNGQRNKWHSHCCIYFR